SSGNTLPGMYKSMWIAPALALILFAALLPSVAVLALAAPLLLVWLASPAIAWWISLPTTPVGFNPSAQDLRFLRMLSRQTWAFFDRYVGPEDNWLPPDNVQEIPKPTIAHRTSPTNMGMALLSHLAAHDFGYLSTGLLLERITAMLESMTGLERHHGHFYNWYDTQTLQPLAPRYVSTVDSGNLVGLLLTLRPGLLGLADTPLFDQRTLGGLADTLDVLQQALQDANLDDRTVLELRAKVDSAIVQDTPDSFLQVLDQADALAIDTAPPSAEEVHYWLQALQAQCTELRAERLRFTLPPAPAQAKAAKPTPTTSTSSLRQLAELDCTLWPPADQAQVQVVQRLARARIIHLEQLAELSASLASMDFTFLYDAQRDLFSIGYNADERRLDNGYYDLLASEVRLTNFVVIAQGQLPQQAWFTLGRLLSNNRGVPVLLSWSGSMFEYLMPNLIMPSYEGTLLEQTCRAAVALQIEHGHQLGIPWGVSESGYNTLDAHFNYQYRAFGVPGLGLKRGLAEDTVVAPYASALALMVEPQAACRNLQRLAAQGSAGRYGLYEAVDYTEARLPRGQRYAVVRSFMAHHQGMSLLALTSLLLDRPMQRRFESIPAFQATVLLLQERVPKT
ncbi:MAG: glucoamylase family protein, partial [Pseudomonas sp.]